ncbi:hypothetical protein AC1031_020393 [Aphanomyces cochlioides]|nr:hypothetical protein AC1031_020393 [Aphanomyces cochlioides]
MATSTKDKEYFKAWYTRNKEKVIARVKEYNATHREAQNARMQQWREKNREKIAAYREIHREQRRQYKRDHYRRTKEKRKQAAAAASGVSSPTLCDDDPTSSRMSLSFLMHPAPPATEPSLEIRRPIAAASTLATWDISQLV